MKKIINVSIILIIILFSYSTFSKSLILGGVAFRCGEMIVIPLDEFDFQNNKGEENKNGRE